MLFSDKTRTLRESKKLPVDSLQRWLKERVCDYYRTANRTHIRYQPEGQQHKYEFTYHQDKVLECQ